MAETTKAQEFHKQLSLKSLTPKERRELLKYSKAWRKKTQKLRDAIEESTRITGEDLATRVY